ncbi:apicoplast import protein Tic20, putative [Plasmodium berghei]|uniref:Apicoplast import protein Tic20, putative n=2 Tax=Plasmodium berghei TaxID=5821 RepID=A0A509ALM3_PLABA|nr:apicoplast import protein Tic20, putative [Plasmodium berghei ANKA]CXI39843.1 apicoplast import protein Tic20, putative [Plasmodium berghei]SCM21753.1 apicoplast import protein Tic20, putative [Plasmodium berghei]SCN25005.1 apicoplast import protein Tic20, putative [Plasmodium berghei]SCO60060.1 apicoplast import protein Tic20, putative [Plasmodium berghei]SCO61527.1 apicoplast import protein Tic20, putative [Plasmodium berghei]|eukprot:XP_034421394.1 apicoplast import protein Tic20, putative [Plasmodium berghei ANKA]
MVRFLSLSILIYFVLLLTNISCFINDKNIKVYNVIKKNNNISIHNKHIISKRSVNLTILKYNKNKYSVKFLKKTQLNTSSNNQSNFTFYGETDVTLFDKLIASAAYILPYMDAIQAYMMPLLNMLPFHLHKYLFLIEKFNNIYMSIPFSSFATFMGLYFMFVKENKFNFHYFIKYHHMQGLILSMFGYALALFYFRVFPYSYNDTDIFNLTVLYSSMIIYFGSLIIPFMASLLGYYIEIPVISEAIKLHIGDKKKKENKDL